MGALCPAQRRPHHAVGDRRDSQRPPFRAARFLNPDPFDWFGSMTHLLV
jgi:hypothetical protein